MSFQQIVKKAGDCIKTERLIGNDPNPRFELFSAPSSICSEKVRSILLIKDLPFLHHDVDLLTHENYHPDYVKMRALGREDLKLVGGGDWTGSTSAAKFGFDPLVVPTLVDHQEQRVVVDSKRIVEYIEEAYPQPPMYPAKYRHKVEKHVAKVDDTPHAGLLYMRIEEGLPDTRPAYLVAAVKEAPEGYIAAIKNILAGHLPNELRPLYQAKIEKTLSVKKVVETKGSMDGAMESTRNILKELEGDLAAHRGPWICGELFTMADIVWNVSIVRFQTFGLSHLFEDLPNVVSYADRILRHPTLVRATYSWPGYIPSPYLNTLLRENAGLALKERNRAMVVLLSFVLCGPKLGLEELLKYLWNDGMGAVAAGGAALAYNVYSNM